MPRPVGSKDQRKASADAHRESCISEAKNLVNEGEAGYVTARQKLGIPAATVFHRNHGRQNRHQAHEYQQTLSAAEEDELVEWLRELDRWGLHLRRSLVINLSTRW
jgi:hypothetical protein